jgi:hypothetical protein
VHVLVTNDIRSDTAEAYFWALLAALGAFIVGAAFSLREGITELLHPSSTSAFAVAYVVLAFSAVFDLLSLRQSAHPDERRSAAREPHHPRSECRHIGSQPPWRLQ